MKDRLTDQQQTEANAVARGEERRLEDVRSRMGNETWADAVGSHVIGSAISLQIEQAHYLFAAQLKAAHPLLEAIAQDPLLSTHFVRGVLRNLRSRQGLTPTENDYQMQVPPLSRFPEKHP
jgi:hypothetical protein